VFLPLAAGAAGCAAAVTGGGGATGGAGASGPNNYKTSLGSPPIPLSSLPPPENSTITATLLQFSYCPRPEDKPVFALLSSHHHTTPTPAPTTAQFLLHGNGSGGGAVPSSFTNPTLIPTNNNSNSSSKYNNSNNASGGKMMMINAHQQERQAQMMSSSSDMISSGNGPHKTTTTTMTTGETSYGGSSYNHPPPLTALSSNFGESGSGNDSSMASLKLNRQVTILRRALKGLCAEKERHQECSQSWAAEREVLLSQIHRLKGVALTGGISGDCSATVPANSNKDKKILLLQELHKEGQDIGVIASTVDPPSLPPHPPTISDDVLTTTSSSSSTTSSTLFSGSGHAELPKSFPQKKDDIGVLVVASAAAAAMSETRQDPTHPPTECSLACPTAPLAHAPPPIASAESPSHPLLLPPNKEVVSDEFHTQQREMDRPAVEEHIPSDAFLARDLAAVEDIDL